MKRKETVTMEMLFFFFKVFAGSERHLVSFLQVQGREEKKEKDVQIFEVRPLLLPNILLN